MSKFKHFSDFCKNSKHSESTLKFLTTNLPKSMNSGMNANTVKKLNIPMGDGFEVVNILLTRLLNSSTELIMLSKIWLASRRALAE